ncbi:hypothetical protein MBLNU230_g5577t1 [Neophaeotheca triangularis]
MNNSPFNKLPPEIRNIIWELTVTSPTDIDVTNSQDYRKGHEPSRSQRINYRTLFQPSKHSKKMTADRQQPPLTLSCRQIRNESLGLYYSANTFIHMLIVPFYAPDFLDRTGAPLKRLTTWLKAIHPVNLPALRKIKITLPGSWCTWPGDPWKKNHEEGLKSLFTALRKLGGHRQLLEVDFELLHDCRSPHPWEVRAHVTLRAEKQLQATEFVDSLKRIYFDRGRERVARSQVKKA